MKNHATAQNVLLPHPALPDADWGDAFAITVNEPDLTASKAARHIINSAPAWYHRLLALRNILVKPFGLKTEAKAMDGDTMEADTLGAIGVFPVISETGNTVIVGLDDLHLNFRIVFETETLDSDRTRVRCMTLVRRNNALGRAYLAVVMPFHNCIVPAMLNAAYTR
ncbi:hypothetical protein UF64_05035 [Thalassospira sp. HJ]|uniref:DUF2867 domain-containing protein n=1 Tax=Thalassospira sp. HJ TaxID=1616823 RepID=UPI0005CF087A|nr:DUF2867 domain-containing protein [Thalassospira sp. HJ]KJE36227.1 hypothetical protein UF64_05035 [Thalassospira sp. HJ]